MLQGMISFINHPPPPLGGWNDTSIYQTALNLAVKGWRFYFHFHKFLTLSRWWDLYGNSLRFYQKKRQRLQHQGAYFCLSFVFKLNSQDLCVSSHRSVISHLVSLSVDKLVPVCARLWLRVLTLPQKMGWKLRSEFQFLLLLKSHVNVYNLPFGSSAGPCLLIRTKPQAKGSVNSQHIETG